MDPTVTLYLSFGSDTDKTVSLVVPRACPDLTGTQIKDLMDELVGTGIVVTKNGRPTAPKSARRLTRTINNVQLA